MKGKLPQVLVALLAILLLTPFIAQVQGSGNQLAQASTSQSSLFGGIGNATRSFFEGIQQQFNNWFYGGPFSPHGGAELPHPTTAAPSPGVSPTPQPYLNLGDLIQLDTSFSSTCKPDLPPDELHEPTTEDIPEGSEDCDWALPEVNKIQFVSDVSACEGNWQAVNITCLESWDPNRGYNPGNPGGCTGESQLEVCAIKVYDAGGGSQPFFHLQWRLTFHNNQNSFIQTGERAGDYLVGTGDNRITETLLFGVHRSSETTPLTPYGQVPPGYPDAEWQQSPPYWWPAGRSIQTQRLSCGHFGYCQWGTGMPEGTTDIDGNPVPSWGCPPEGSGYNACACNTATPLLPYEFQENENGEGVIAVQLKPRGCDHDINGTRCWDGGTACLWQDGLFNGYPSEYTAIAQFHLSEAIDQTALNPDPAEGIGDEDATLPCNFPQVNNQLECESCEDFHPSSLNDFLNSCVFLPEEGECPGTYTGPNQTFDECPTTGCAHDPRDLCWGLYDPEPGNYAPVTTAPDTDPCAGVNPWVAIEQAYGPWECRYQVPAANILAWEGEECNKAISLNRHYRFCSPIYARYPGSTLGAFTSNPYVGEISQANSANSESRSLGIATVKAQTVKAKSKEPQSTTENKTIWQKLNAKFKSLIKQGILFWQQLDTHLKELATEDGNKGGKVLQASTGPLRIHPDNPRYFTRGSGPAIYMTGSHTWFNFHQNNNLATNTTTAEYFSQYLDFMVEHGHNFTRLWTGISYLNNPPFPWERPGPGTAHDGNPQLDMTRFDQTYFNDLKERITQLENRGMYASIMFFGSHNGLKSNFINTAWHPDNNINEELEVFDNDGYSFFTTDPEALEIQKMLVRKFIDELNDFNNIIWEIMNEPGGTTEAVQWQNEMINYTRDYESTKPKQHLVGMTGGWNLGTQMLSSPADWISPDWDGHSEGPGDYREGGPADYAEKIVINDTDHLWAWSEPEEVEEIRQWVWKTFTRGNHPIFMDNYDDNNQYNDDPSVFDPVRDSMGDTLNYANRFTDLASMIPSETISSTDYCLTNEEEYLAYQPSSGSLRINLVAGDYEYEWFNPRTHSIVETGTITADGGRTTFTPPFSGDAVIYLKLTSALPTPTPTEPEPTPTPSAEPDVPPADGNIGVYWSAYVRKLNGCNEYFEGNPIPETTIVGLPGSTRPPHHTGYCNNESPLCNTTDGMRCVNLDGPNVCRKAIRVETVETSHRTTSPPPPEAFTANCLKRVGPGKSISCPSSNCGNENCPSPPDPTSGLCPDGNQPIYDCGGQDCCVDECPETEGCTGVIEDDCGYPESGTACLTSWDPSPCSGDQCPNAEDCCSIKNHCTGPQPPGGNHNMPHGEGNTARNCAVYEWTERKNVYTVEYMSNAITLTLNVKNLSSHPVPAVPFNWDALGAEFRNADDELILPNNNFDPDDPPDGIDPNSYIVYETTLPSFLDYGGSEIIYSDVRDSRSTEKDPRLLRLIRPQSQTHGGEVKWVLSPLPAAYDQENRNSNITITLTIVPAIIGPSGDSYFDDYEIQALDELDYYIDSLVSDDRLVNLEFNAIWANTRSVELMSFWIGQGVLGTARPCAFQTAPCFTDAEALPYGWPNLGVISQDWGGIDGAETSDGRTITNPMADIYGPRYHELGWDGAYKCCEGDADNCQKWINAGIDITPPGESTWSPNVFSTQAGHITKVYNEETGFDPKYPGRGYYVEIQNTVDDDCQPNFATRYANLAAGSIRVGVGEYVPRHKLLGLMGDSGTPGYVHLHYTIRTAKPNSGDIKETDIPDNNVGSDPLLGNPLDPDPAIDPPTADALAHPPFWEEPDDLEHANEDSCKESPYECYEPAFCWSDPNATPEEICYFCTTRQRGDEVRSCYYANP